MTWSMKAIAFCCVWRGYILRARTRVASSIAVYAADALPLRALQGEELHVDLHVVPGDLLLVPVGVHGAPAHAVREPVQPVALERPVHRGIAHPDAVVAFQVPHDPDGPEVVGPLQVENLLDDSGGRGLRMEPGYRPPVDEARLARALIGPLPHVEQRPRDAGTTGGVVDAPSAPPRERATKGDHI